MTTRVTRDVFDGVVRPILNIDIDGGSIDDTPIGVNTPNVGYFTNLFADNLTVTGTADFTGATTVGLNAFYADLAERYKSDMAYEPGTVVKLGGENEITKTTKNGDEDVFGVISTNPAFVLNHDNDHDDLMLPVVLVGRVPCFVEGPVSKGQRLMAGPDGVAKATKKFEHNDHLVFARSLVDDYRKERRLVEVAVVTIK
jgi:hypothetical protein